MTTDVILEVNDEGFYDIQFTSAGDIATIEALDTPILMGIFTERRAAASEVPESFERRGWLGNESTPGFEMGSKLWQFFQARASFDTFTGIQGVLRAGQQWLIDDNLAENVSVEAVLRQATVIANITFFRSSSRVDQSSFELWNNTGSTF